MNFKLEDLDNLDEIVYKKDIEDNQSKGISKQAVIKELEIISNGIGKIKEDKNTDKVKKQTEKNKEPKIIENDSFTSMTADERQALLELFKLTEEKYSNNDGKYDFRQVRNILPIDEWLNDDYYVPFTKYIYPYWKDYIVELFKGQEGKNFELPYNEVVVGGCFTGDTKVFTNEYGDKSFIEIKELLEQGKTLTIKSWNEDLWILEDKKITSSEKLGTDRELVEITLINSCKYKCTPDHKHLTADGEWVRADELQIGQDLLSPYFYNGILRGNYSICKIEKLKEKADVWCINVEDNHNFMLNGVIVLNSIGCGKSTLATILVMRMIYIISCFENIQSLYSLMPGSPLYICIISVNREVAESTLYGDLLTKIDMTPYFQEKFPRNKRINSLIAFPNNLTIMFGSNVNSVIGKNIICFAADEMNFRQGGAEQTNEFYAYLLARNKSRFIYEGGKNGSLAILMSSATTSTSIVEQRKIEALKDSKISTRDPSLWEVKPKSYSKDRFPLFTGSLSCEPQIIKGYPTLKTILKEEGLNISDDIFPKADNIKEEYYNILYVIKDILPDNIASAIKEVPLELYVDFESNLIYSMQNLAGVAVSPSGRLFTSKRKYNDALDDNIPYPFVTNKIVLSTGDDKTILDYLRMDYRNEIKNKEVPRFIHIDGSFAGDTENRKADHTGISCCHISGVRITDSGTKLPLITIDWQLEVVSPKAPNQISFQKVADIVYTMNDIIGINIKDGSVTYDGFQSQYAIQLFNANGYNSFVKSLDRTDIPYIDLINLFYEDRIKLKNHTTSQKELFELIHYRENRKVDHPADGSKDLIDSVCGCVNGAINSEYFANRYLEITNPSNFINADDYLAKLALEEKSKKIEITSDDDIFINQTINKLWKR